MAVDIFGIQQTKRRDCFDENDTAITKLLNEKNRLHEKLLSSDGPAKIAAEQAFREVKWRLQYKIRQLKNNRWSKISAESRRAYDCKDSKSLYSTVQAEKSSVHNRRQWHP